MVSPEQQNEVPPEGPGEDTYVDGFRLQRLLGQGASGQVYLAQDVALGRRVALKLLRPELLGAEGAARLLEEARTTARFSHPHIVTVYATGTFRGQPYLALEYLEGETLRERMTRAELARGEALRIAWAVADALAEAHRHGVIHADLKPENVIIPRDGRLRVVDFGLARHAGAAHTAASGTPAYMSPERWRGAPPAPSMDVWALGILLHELLVGRRPLRDDELSTLAFKPRRLPPAPVAPALAVLINQCLDPDPAARPAAESVAEALTALMEPARPADPEEGDDSEERLPFPGLRAFSADEADGFSGREAEVDALVERLRGDGAVVLVGPSGVGKSSLLHAGLLPRLAQLGPWTCVSLRPGPHPLRRLAEALELEPSIAAALAERPGELVEALRARGNRRALLAFDAFEEVFTLAAPEEALALARCLAALAGSDSGWRVVLVLRDDYLGHFARLEPLRPLLGSAFVVGPLSTPALVQAVSGPLRRAGYSTDAPDLVARIARDVAGESAGLPLLQSACAALWERRDRERRLLLASEYEAMGGAAGALAAQGRQLLGQLPAESVRTVRTLLLRLLTSSGTRRPRPRTELLEGLEAEAGRLLDLLLARRLVVTTRDVDTDEPTVELAHESLATAWPDLARWREDSREEHRLVQELEEASELWDRRGRREAETWEGEGLVQALRRVEAGSVPLGSRARAFLEAGRQQERRRVRRRRIVAVAALALLVLALFASTLAAFSFRERQLEALRQQEQVRLAAADVGRFDLVLEFHDFDPVAQAWTRVPASGPLRWTLAPADREGAPGAPYGAVDVQRTAGRVDAQGDWRERVEAPSREAWLTVERAGCPSSQVRLRQLPGYAERSGEHAVRVPIPTCAASRVGMVEIPAGPYLRPPSLGATEPEQIEVARYSIDLTEVTNGQLRLFEERVLPLSSGVRQLPPIHPVYARAREPLSPATGLDAATAEAYCRFLGKSLPEVDEWMKAARGGLHLDALMRTPNPFPQRPAVWGELRTPPPANLDGPDGFPGPAPVGSFPLDRSPYGVLDLAGNVAEWSASTAASGNFRGLRRILGGRWDSPLKLAHERLGWMNHLDARHFDLTIGLRCVERTPGGPAAGIQAIAPRDGEAPRLRADSAKGGGLQSR